MAVHISQAWREELSKDIALYKESGKHFSRTTGIPVAKRYVVIRLTENAVPYRVLNRGCGVTTITTETDTCPKCSGTGRI